MQRAASLKDAYDRLRRDDLQTLQAQLDALDRDTLPKLREELRSADAQSKELHRRKQFAEQLHTDVVLIDKYAAECGEAERKIEQLMRNSSAAEANSQVIRILLYALFGRPMNQTTCV